MLRHSARSWATIHHGQSWPASATARWRPSLHRVHGRPRPRLLAGSVHMSSFVDQRPSSLLAMWPAHLHFLSAASSLHALTPACLAWPSAASVALWIQSCHGSKHSSSELSSEQSADDEDGASSPSVCTCLLMPNIALSCARCVVLSCLSCCRVITHASQA